MVDITLTPSGDVPLAATMGENDSAIISTPDGTRRVDSVALGAFLGIPTSAKKRVLADWDASTGAFPDFAQRGDWFLVSGAGTVDGEAFAEGEELLAIVDDPSTATFADNWRRYPGQLLDTFTYPTQAAMLAETSTVPNGSVSTAAGNMYLRVASGGDLVGVANSFTDLQKLSPEAMTYWAGAIQIGSVTPFIGDVRYRRSAATGADSATASVGVDGFDLVLPTTRETEATTTFGAHFWDRIRSNSADVFVFVGSDSTGNETTEWPYLYATYLGSVISTHTVKARFWDNVGKAWGAYVTLSTGSGAQVVSIDIAAVAGANSWFLQGVDEAAIFARSDYSLAILNFGHNLGTNAREETAITECMIAAAHLQTRSPNATILVTAQNPRTSENGFGQSSGVSSAWRKVADLLGCGLIDVFSAFLDYGSDWSTDLMTDETHPNAAGQAIWVDAIKRVMGKPSAIYTTTPRPVPFPALDTLGRNLIGDPWFSDWVSGSDPKRWTITNCTVAKEVGRSDGAPYSMRVIPSASLGTISTSLPAATVRLLRGRRVSLMSRVWKNDTASSLQGRIDISASNGVTATSATSRDRGVVGAGGWQWAMSTLDVPDDAITISVSVYSGDATDNGKTMYIQLVSVFAGVLPYGLSAYEWQKMTIEEYYSPLNVGRRSASDNGTVTTTDNSFALVGASPSANSNVVINLPELDPGVAYVMTFDVGNGDGIGSATHYARSGPNSTGVTLASGNALRNTTGNTLTFTPTTGVASIWFHTGGAGSGYEIDNITIAKV
jgi:hypothetical protein